MVWRTTSDRAEHQERSLALSDAYDKRGRSGRELEAAVRAVTIGVGFRVRAFTIYEKDQAELPL